MYFRALRGARVHRQPKPRIFILPRLGTRLRRLGPHRFARPHRDHRTRGRPRVHRRGTRHGARLHQQGQRHHCDDHIVQGRHGEPGNQGAWFILFFSQYALLLSLLSSSLMLCLYLHCERTSSARLHASTCT